MSQPFWLFCFLPTANQPEKPNNLATFPLPGWLVSSCRYSYSNSFDVGKILSRLGSGGAIGRKKEFAAGFFNLSPKEITPALSLGRSGEPHLAIFNFFP